MDTAEDTPAGMDEDQTPSPFIVDNPSLVRRHSCT